MARIERQNLVERVYAIVRRDILSLRLEPGEKINLSATAKSMDISLSPLREAINRLAEGGLVQSCPRRGYFVVKFSSKDIRDLFRLRRIFESEALSDFSQIDRGAHNEKLRKLRTEMANLVKRKNDKEKNRDFQRLDEEFHKILLEVSDNLRLRALYRQIWDLVILARRTDQALFDQVNKPLAEHIAIADALLGKNTDKAKRLLHSHILQAEERVVETRNI